MRVSGRTRVLAVVGDPVAHSLSPVMHNAAIRALGLDAVYVALKVTPGGLRDALSMGRDVGLAGNATVPHKEALAALVDRRTATCERAGACNTFWTEDGRLIGDNTDVAGVLGALEALDVSEQATWLVLGTGGAARAVAIAAADRGARLLVRSRSPDRGARFATWARTLGPDVRCDGAGHEPQVVINASPLGLGAEDPLPIEPDDVPTCRVALDLVYAAGGTRWCRAMARAGARTADGRVMLVEQGLHAFERFFPGQRAPREVMLGAVDRALRD